MKLLDDHFVSSWSLVVELKALEKDENRPKIATLAKQALEKYKFPVMMYVWTPEGDIIYGDNANEFLDKEQTETSSIFNIAEDPAGLAYANFLKRGLKEAKAHYQALGIRRDYKV